MYEPGFIYGKGGVKIAKVRDAPMVLGGRGRGGFRREFSRETSLRREPSMRSMSPPPPRGPAGDRCVEATGHLLESIQSRLAELEALTDGARMGKQQLMAEVQRQHILG